LRKRPPSPLELRDKARAQVQRKALRTLAKARAGAARAGVELSEWEDAFLGSLSDRVKTFGRGFADPEKGGPGSAFSVRQIRKIKEIKAKTVAERTAAAKPADEDDA